MVMVMVISLCVCTEAFSAMVRRDGQSVLCGSTSYKPRRYPSACHSFDESRSEQERYSGGDDGDDGDGQSFLTEMCDVVPDEVREICEQFLEDVKEKVGSSEFLGKYEEVRMFREKRREQRRRTRAVEAVADPAAAALRKEKQSMKKKRRRKEKVQQQKDYRRGVVSTHDKAIVAVKQRFSKKRKL